MSETKFAFIIDGGDKYPEPIFQNFPNTTKICGVKDLDTACVVAKELVEEGYNLIELCGDFQKEGYLKIKEAVDGKAKIGYVIFED